MLSIEPQTYNLLRQLKTTIVQIAHLLSFVHQIQLFTPTVSAAPFVSLLKARAAPAKYFAQGDSYGSGIASGDYVDPQAGSPDWFCSRFTAAYGRQLNDLLGGASQFTHQACSGATAETVQKTQDVDSDADLATLTVGGNNADFGKIVDNCVYGFSPGALNDEKCASALSATNNNIANNVWNPVWNTVWNILNTAKKSTFQLYLTNYPKFWNAGTSQCNSISFSYWGGTNAEYTMTQARRKSMNDLTDKLNAQLASVVENFRNNDPPELRVHLVNIDSHYDGHRFCEDGFDEPQQPSTDGTQNGWIFQYNTPTGSLDGNSSVGPDAGYGSGWVSSIKAAQQADPSLTVNSLYASQPVSTDEDFGSSGGLPPFLSKLFHPTQPGHAAITQAINEAIGQEPVSVPQPSPKCTQDCECSDTNPPKCKCRCLCDGDGAPDSQCQ